VVDDGGAVAAENLVYALLYEHEIQRKADQLPLWEHREPHGQQRTPLLMAAQMGNLPIFKAILSHIQVVPETNWGEVWRNQKDTRGANALMYAAEYDHINILQFILLHFCTSLQSMLTEQENRGRTTLMVAVRYGRDDVVQEILSHIRSFETDSQIMVLNQKEIRGWTALMIAAYFDRASVVQEILSRIDSFDTDSKKKVLNEKKNDGYTALMIAACDGHVGVVQQILSHISGDKRLEKSVLYGSWVERVVGRKGRGSLTALKLAKHNNHTVVAELLTDVGGCCSGCLQSF